MNSWPILLQKHNLKPGNTDESKIRLASLQYTLTLAFQKVTHLSFLAAGGALAFSFNEKKNCSFFFSNPLYFSLEKAKNLLFRRQAIVLSTRHHR